MANKHPTALLCVEWPTAALYGSSYALVGMILRVHLAGPRGSA
jgi:hypothetical protein